MVRLVAPPEPDIVVPVRMPYPADAPFRAETWVGTERSRDEIVAAAQLLPMGRSSRPARGLKRALAALEQFPGDSWQDRWDAAGCSAAGSDWATHLGNAWEGLTPAEAQSLQPGAAGLLVILDVIRPTYDWIRDARLNKFPEVIRDLREPEFFRKAEQHRERMGYAAMTYRHTLSALSKMMMHTGKSPSDLTADDVIHFQNETKRLGGKSAGLPYAWDLLRLFGGLPDDILPLREAVRTGQLTVEEMVDFYVVNDPGIKALLIRYLSERAVSLDYTTIRGLAYKLVKVFWLDLQEHHPDLATLALERETSAAWLHRIRTGKLANKHSIFFAVRAFYLDIAHWATQDPYWSSWAAPCFLTRDDTRGHLKHKRRVQAKIHQKIRTFAPSMPRLLGSCDEQRRKETDLLTAAAAAEEGTRFVFEGIDYERAPLKSRTSGYRGAGRVWINKISSGERIDQTYREQQAFWSWAVVNTLHWTGARLEELLETTSTALFIYTIPSTNETVPLLQIVPSKTDEERVLLVTPELAHVFAQIKHRIRDGAGKVPLTTRYDQNERTISAPLPYLFQHQHGSQQRVMSSSTVGSLIRDAIRRAGILDGTSEPAHLTAHDFRRIFATDALSGGLPVHIIASLLGHQSINTTQGYTAVYQEDVMTHYHGFVSRRRALRPSEEYRKPTDTEWDDFVDHFAQRKLELGSCGRGYGTPCAHEHACIRCPMLRPDPAQRPRLEEIAVNLEERILEAIERGWKGESEGLAVSLAAAKEQLQKMTHIVQLGTPAMPPRTT